MIHALPLAHAAIAQLYMYALGLTMTTSMCSKNDMACCHCWPFPQLSMILLYVMTSGKQLSSLMSAKSCKLPRHWLVLPKRLIALLNLKVSISDCFATETIQAASEGLQMWSGQEPKICPHQASAQEFRMDSRCLRFNFSRETVNRSSLQDLGSHDHNGQSLPTARSTLKLRSNSTADLRPRCHGSRRPGVAARPLHSAVVFRV